MFFKKKKERKILIAVFNGVLNYVKEWNEKTFPDATMAGQLAKLEEEIQEMKDADNEDNIVKEIADMAIVMGGLRRWSSLLGAFHEKHLLSTLDNKALARLIAEIAKKMTINQERKWEKVEDGKYHHTPKKKKK